MKSLQVIDIRICVFAITLLRYVVHLVYRLLQ